MSDVIVQPTKEEELAYEVKDLREELRRARIDAELRYRDGIIVGLKYAIRCNGISGAEVKE